MIPSDNYNSKEFTEDLPKIDYIQLEYSQCSRPQTAYAVYLRLLEISSRNQTNASTTEPAATSTEIMLAAFTGCNLSYRQ